MWERFKKRKPVATEAESVTRDKIAGFVANKLIQVQQAWSVWMSKNFEKLSVMQKKLILSVLGVIMSIYCAYLIVASFMVVIPANDFAFTTASHNGIHRLPGQVPTQPDLGVLDKLVAFENYMADLEKTADGKVERDRILTSHPGLMDSLRTLKTYYENNK